MFEFSSMLSDGPLPYGAMREICDHQSYLEKYTRKIQMSFGCPLCKI